MMNSTTQPHKPSLGVSSLYLLFVILSLVVSWGIFAQFLVPGDATIVSFFQQALATPVARLVSSDIIISALVFFVFAYRELRRLGAPRYWLVVYIVTTSSVGVCFALSLFLFQREVWMKRS
jgi:Terpene cyclase DEP1